MSLSSPNRKYHLCRKLVSKTSEQLLEGDRQAECRGHRLGLLYRLSPPGPGNARLGEYKRAKVRNRRAQATGADRSVST